MRGKSAMDFKENIDENLNWEKVNKKDAHFSKNITDKSVLNFSCTECSWCKSKLIKTQNKNEYEMFKELIKTEILNIPFDFAAKSEEAAFNKFKKMGFPIYKNELHLPLRCNYSYEKLFAPKNNYRIKGSYHFEISTQSIDYYPYFKVCPCCGNDVYSANEEIEKLEKMEYDKLITKYKSKAEKFNSKIDLSKFDICGYLGTLVELYKESYILEKQIKSLIIEKHSCRKESLIVKTAYINANRDKNISCQYIAAEKKLNELQAEKANGILLSSIEKNAAWETFLANDDEWNILTVKTPIEPVKPEEPTAPEKPIKVQPAPINFDMTRLIEPTEPNYLQGNFFNKRRITKQNAGLKLNYERAIEDYKTSCQEYEKALAEYKKLCNDADRNYQVSLEKYNQDQITYTNNYNEFLNKTNLYLIEKAKYEEEMNNYNTKLNKIEILSQRIDDKKKEIYEKALQNKIKRISNEEAELIKILNDFDAELRAKLEKETSELPKKIANDTMVKFLDVETANLIKDLFEIYAAIDELKSLNVIYPKYTEFSTLCTLYEYFLSGRTNELAGPQGAYNLYESEKRADNIINKLDIINYKLDDILNELNEVKNNQVLLYSTMKEIKKGVDKLNSNISNMVVEMEEIGDDLTSHKDSVNLNSDSVSSKSKLPTSITSLSSYLALSSFMDSQRQSFNSTVKQASVIKRGIAGGLIAGPAGAIVGALSAVDKNRRN